MTTDTTTRSFFPVGTFIISYNKWTDWQIPREWDIFHNLEYEEVRNLVAGDHIWVDVDPIHPNGKVYGRQLKLVTRREYVPEGGVRIHFQGGMRWVRFDDPSGKFATIKDEVGARRLCDTDDRAYCPGLGAYWVDPREETPI